ncbi:hypothetical protein [Streptomyces sp. NPDC048737]|uniref:hypothetical protein n=1 Tax=unclassified Streptomyces TaxID=2593676 RepID=UPI00341DB29A
MDRSTFQELLPRLMEGRGLDFRLVSELTGLPQAELMAVADGVMPDSEFLGRLAPVLRWRAVDLLVVAGASVPEDELRFDGESRIWIPRLVSSAMRIPVNSRIELLEYARSMPEGEVRGTSSIPKAYEQYGASSGALVVRMLANRNLDWPTSAKVLYHASGLTFAASTIGAIAHGRKGLTPDLVDAFGGILGIPSSDLSALTGVEMSDDSSKRTAEEIADLIWEVRFLDHGRLRVLAEEAHRMGG